MESTPCPLLIVIVNYRTAELTVECLATLAPEVAALPGARAVVVDNASGDGSATTLAAALRRHGWNGWASLAPAERNGGFAYGNNLALRPALAAAPDFVLLLNPDTLVRPGALRALLDFMAEHPEAGIAGSRLEDPDGTPQHSAFRFHGLLSEFNAGLRLGLLARLFPDSVVAPPLSDTPCRTDWVAGASMLVRREVFEAIGLLDEGYFMYFEEMDFCRRAGRAGFACWYVPASRVVHLVGQASGVTDPKRATRRRPAYWFESRRRYWLTNHGPARAAAADALLILGSLLFRARCVLQRKPNTDPEYFLRDLLRHSLGWTRSETSLWARIHEDWLAHGRDWTKPGFRAVAIHRFGNWRLRIRPKPLRAPFSLLYRALYRHCRNRYGIELPYSAQVGRRVVIEHQGAIVIHGAAVIGDDCVIRQGVTLGNRMPERPHDAPRLGRQVDVGAGAKILGAVTVGDGARIGANAVVLEDVPANALAVGVPARIRTARTRVEARPAWRA